MVDKIFYPQPILPVGPSKDKGQLQRAERQSQAPFKDILDNQMAAGGLKFSAHARQRLAARNIRLTPEDLAKIGSAVNKAAEKGAQDSLILMDRLALVVSVRNKTVVTAVDDTSMKEHVFTKIDSAVII